MSEQNIYLISFKDSFLIEKFEVKKYRFDQAVQSYAMGYSDEQKHAGLKFRIRREEYNKCKKHSPLARTFPLFLKS